MKLPKNFQFNQSNLQDFVDCQRRFQLKYLLSLTWPSVEAQPVVEYERRTELGSLFHQMVHQYTLGIPANMLHVSSRYEELVPWWENFQYAISESGTIHDAWQTSSQRFAEVTVNGVLADARVVAKLDLVAINSNGKVSIFDWKTTRQPPKRTWLAERIQTILYPWLLVQAGAFLNNNHTILPEQVEMIYWYAELPKAPVRFPYNQRKMQADQEELIKIIKKITQLEDSEFNMTSDEHKCSFCVYRSLCVRGVQAGQLSDYDHLDGEVDEDQFILDFNQIEDISY